MGNSDNVTNIFNRLRKESMFVYRRFYTNNPTKNPVVNKSIAYKRKVYDAVKFVIQYLRRYDPTIAAADVHFFPIPVAFRRAAPRLLNVWEQNEGPRFRFPVELVHVLGVRKLYSKII